MLQIKAYNIFTVKRKKGNIILRNYRYAICVPCINGFLIDTFKRKKIVSVYYPLCAKLNRKNTCFTLQFLSIGTKSAEILTFITTSHNVNHETIKFIYFAGAWRLLLLPDTNKGSKNKMKYKKKKKNKHRLETKELSFHCKPYRQIILY